MGLLDVLKATENKQLNNKVSELESKIIELQNMLTPEMLDLLSLNEKIKQTNIDLEIKNNEIIHLTQESQKLTAELSVLKQNIVETNDEILLQEFGFYKPMYDFASSDLFKTSLDIVRENQKKMIKAGSAVSGAKDWTVNGNNAKGKKMVADMQKLLLRAFNGECDELVANVKFNNFDSCKKRIVSSRDAISKLGTIMNISISQAYLDLKIKELHLAHEYRVKKQEEKEEAKRIRDELREEAKVQKELEDARKGLKKEESHYNNALAKINKQLENASDIEKELLLIKQKEIEEKISEINASIESVDYREANQRAGYVYIISNIGSFGENVYKIGMTRRLEPMERINELGDASVPFNFDVHALIFTEDAPKLENSLHKAFDDKKVNMINTRREFFNVNLEEIEKVVKENHDKTIEFVRSVPAEQYRQTQKIKNNTLN